MFSAFTEGMEFCANQIAALVEKRAEEFDHAAGWEQGVTKDGLRSLAAEIRRTFGGAA